MKLKLLLYILFQNTKRIIFMVIKSQNQNFEKISVQKQRYRRQYKGIKNSRCTYVCECKNVKFRLFNYITIVVGMKTLKKLPF